MAAKGTGGREYWYTFINIYAFVLDNFCFFEHANELEHVQIHLTSFIEFTMVLNQTWKGHLELSYFVFKAFWKFWRKSLKKTCGIFLNEFS